MFMATAKKVVNKVKKVIGKIAKKEVKKEVKTKVASVEEVVVSCSDCIGTGLINNQTICTICCGSGRV